MEFSSLPASKEKYGRLCQCILDIQCTVYGKGFFFLMILWRCHFPRDSTMVQNVKARLSALVVTQRPLSTLVRI